MDLTRFYRSKLRGIRPGEINLATDTHGRTRTFFSGKISDHQQAGGMRMAPRMGRGHALLVVADLSVVVFVGLWLIL